MNNEQETNSETGTTEETLQTDDQQQQQTEGQGGTEGAEGQQQGAEGAEGQEGAEGAGEAEAESIDVEALAFPEGFERSEELVTKFTEILQGTEGSLQERAQALIDLHNDAMKTASERISQQWQDVRSDWVEQTKGLPQIGGENLEGTLGNIAKMIDVVGEGELAEQFRTVMDESGLGDHPVVVQFLSKASKPFLEGTSVQGSPTDRSMSQAERLFPNMAKQE